MPQLNRCLALLNVSELKQCLQALPNSRYLPTRKAELQQRLVQTLNPENCQWLWQQLSPLEQHAVAETLHCTGGLYTPDRLAAKYNELPSGGGHNMHGHRSNYPLLNLLFYRADKDDSRYWLPEEIGLLLRPFVKPPAPFTLTTLPDGSDELLDTTIIEREYTAQSELTQLMGMMEQGQLKISSQTGKPSAALLKQLSLDLDEYYPELNDEDCHYPQHIKAFGWCQLLRYAPWVNLTNGRFKLDRRTLSQYSQSTATLIRAIWSAWIEQDAVDEFRRIDVIKGQTGKGASAFTDVTARRQQCINALRHFHSMSGDQSSEWISITAFSRLMRIEGFDFEVTDDPWSLYMFDRHYGTLGYDADWAMLEGRYLRVLLLEYAATLGLIDVALTLPNEAEIDFGWTWGSDDLSCLSRYDGLLYFRLTALGRYCFGITKHYDNASPKHPTPLTVSANCAIRLSAPLQPSEQLQLELYADKQNSTSWQLSPDKIIQRAEQHDDLSDLRQFLAARDPQPFLPEPVEQLLTKSLQNANAISVVSDTKLLRCQSETLAKQLALASTTAPLCLYCGDDLLTIKAKDEKRFRNAVRKLGLGMPLA